MQGGYKKTWINFFVVAIILILSAVGQTTPVFGQSQEQYNKFTDLFEREKDFLLKQFNSNGCFDRVHDALDESVINKFFIDQAHSDSIEKRSSDLEILLREIFSKKNGCDSFSEKARKGHYNGNFSCQGSEQKFYAFDIYKSCITDDWYEGEGNKNVRDQYIKIVEELIRTLNPEFKEDKGQVNPWTGQSDTQQGSSENANGTGATGTVISIILTSQGAEQPVADTPILTTPIAQAEAAETQTAIAQIATAAAATQAAMQTETVRTQTAAVTETAIAQTEAFGTKTALAQIVTSEAATQAAMHAAIIAQRATATQAAIIKIEQERIDQEREFWIKIIGGMIVIVAGAAVWLLTKRRKKRANRSARRRSAVIESKFSPQERRTLRLEDDFGTDSKTMEIAQANPFLQFDFGSMQHQGKRDYQEDSFGFSDLADPELVAKRGILAIVADGMGGLKNGKSISERAIQKFRRSFVKFSPSGDIPQQMLALVAETNHDIYETDKQKGGTTLLCVYIYRNSMHWISVGDSAIFLFRKGRLYQLNKEHNRLNDLYLKFMYREMTKEQLMAEPSLQGLTSNIGRRELRDVDRNLTALKLQSGDRILLCTDGVSGRLTEKELLVAISQANAQSCADAMKRMILKKNAPKQDNFTAEVIFCD